MSLIDYLRTLASKELNFLFSWRFPLSSVAEGSDMAAHWRLAW